MAPCPSVLRASGETATGRAGPRSRNPLTSRFRIMRSKRQVQQALLPGLNTGPDQGKGAGGLHEQPGRMIRHPLPVQFGQSSFEIVVDQRDRQVGGALDDANAELAQRGAERSRTLHVDRFNAHPTISEILLRDSRRQAKARPVAGHGAGGSGRCRDDIAALNQPLEGFLDLVGRKIFAPARERVPEGFFRPLPWRWQARNKARRAGRTSGPRNRGIRRRAATHRP